ncbi:DUF3153 domain-containing protein [Cyanobacterium aponinum AL20118]|uniref:DUF3153 domain-containing protein n=2 Tax=Cyanobacterium aponinum TaxID=379064 RepID=A0A844GTB5_9CHRO|nr:DUF3153 domain-containing protein [Cyanobacterium aponinum]MTF38038.1 DUF3153 domain-containing protein [Cyanobacterium aponinum 0216]PHV63108.1 hypothetical protein CSQ80_07030 [Cyanobacterium aponinum IPPAS B-1201]WPF88847.1 DUF3153 domain-containing protein [Cyanobacterium aponinum AL20115]
MKKIFIFLALCLCLTGCVRYDVGIQFPQANHGTMIQHIKLGEQLTNFSEKEGNAWLNSIERRALKLQGKSKRLSQDELVVTIPFSNGQDLVKKFNQFFIPTLGDKSSQKISDNNSNSLLDLSAKMSIKQNNLLFLERNTLNFDADLTPLGVVSSEGNIIISSGDLINLQIQFDFPLGAKLTTNEFAQWEKLPNNQYNIQLSAGQINQLQAVFWLPNYIGLGASAIALFIILGFYLKYQKLPLI